MRALNIFFACGWIAFWTYWLLSAAKSEKNSRLSIKNSVAPRLAIIIFVIVIVVLSRHGYNTTGYFSHILGSDWTQRILGIVFFIVGLLFAIWARVNLGKHWGMPMAIKLKTQLVITGPYNFVRHPIYTGVLLGTLGTAFALGGYWLFPLIVSGIYFVYSAFIEEKMMQKQFPETYPGYKNRTKMFIPFLI